ncbi:hypothetical protein SCLCIDRAFT_17134 [Scleroderma citrinum Foug A]|uniref:G domain-containing protein n=1 Tax=Scleroderma citrinum Foug A TaxID=1036808 RepID=A0A0C3D7I6_9AGAM|nr:hypothetical protein SCLCIDRAFT_17134 [Scleroderma citrinum Foug A]
MDVDNLVSKFKASFATLKIAEDDLVVFVVGPTGAGKSWFVKELANNDKVRVGKNGHHPCTTDVEAWKCHFEQGQDNVVIVDTPSFCTEVDGFDAEGTMKSWITSRLSEKCRHSGILFLHTLARDPTDPDTSMERHLNIFSSSFPARCTVPMRVCVVPTMEPACKLGSERIEERLAQLDAETMSLDGPKWSASMFPSVFAGQPDVAWEVVQKLLEDITAD